MYEYLARSPLLVALKPEKATVAVAPAEASAGIDRTAKLYIGGKQVRPDGNYSFAVAGARAAGRRSRARQPQGYPRRGLEAARAATKSWGEATGYNRSQVLYFGRKPVGPRRRLRRAAGGTRRRRQKGSRGGGGTFRRAAVRGGRHGRQVRGAGAQPAGPRRHAGTLHEPVGVLGVAPGRTFLCSGWCRWPHPRSRWATRSWQCPRSGSRWWRPTLLQCWNSTCRQGAFNT